MDGVAAVMFGPIKRALERGESVDQIANAYGLARHVVSELANAIKPAVQSPAGEPTKKGFLGAVKDVFFHSAQRAGKTEAAKQALVELEDWDRKPVVLGEVTDELGHVVSRCYAHYHEVRATGWMADAFAKHHDNQSVAKEQAVILLWRAAAKECGVEDAAVATLFRLEEVETWRDEQHRRTGIRILGQHYPKPAPAITDPFQKLVDAAVDDLKDGTTYVPRRGSSHGPWEGNSAWTRYDRVHGIAGRTGEEEV
jgi:hypothetical protein